jgi:hypothetical protein
MMLLIASDTPLRFPKVTGMALLVVFSNCVLNASVRGLRLMETFPVPFIPKPVDEPSAKAITTWEVLGPIETGVNVTENVQLAPATTLLPQVLVCAKLVGFGPPTVTLLIFRALVLLFLRVTILAALVNPAC